MPRSATRRADAPVTTGAMHGDRPQQRTVAAGRAASIAGSAANSVFALGSSAPRGGHRQRLPALDVSQLVVRDGVPPPPGSGGRTKGRTRYDDVFALLTADGQSVVIPREYKAAIQKASYTYARHHKAALGASKLRVLVLEDGTAAVFREAKKA